MGLLSFNLLNKILTCYFLYAHTQKWQNCQRADGGHILVDWLIDWLIIYGFTSRSRIFHLYGDVTIAG
jgi:hypothetical protein